MTQQLKKKKIVLRKVIPSKVLEEILAGNKFIVLEEDIDNVPEGYTLVDMKFKDSSFKTLVPQQLLFYMANPGEGSIDDALDEISDFYDNVKDFEDESIEEGRTNVQDINWAMTSRDAYHVYLINKLTSNGKDFDDKTIKELNLNDPYVRSRVEAIAALCLEKSPEELKQNKNLSDILRHVEVSTGEKETSTVEELRRVRCDVGSHYEWKDQYVPVKKTVEKKESYVVLDKKIHEIEKEIHDYRAKKGEVDRHDDALIRQYINLGYIAKEKPEAQLDIKPSEKTEKNETK